VGRDVSVLVRTDEFVSIMTTANPAPPCEIEEVLDKSNRCHEPANWIVFWRDRCANGGTIVGSKANTLCTKHKEFLLIDIDRVNLTCAGCGQAIRGMGHMINRVEGL
jgi:hypothetical protein